MFKILPKPDFVEFVGVLGRGGRRAEGGGRRYVIIFPDQGHHLAIASGGSMFSSHMNALDGVFDGIYNVRAFGAVGNGTDDDLPAFHATLRAMSADSDSGGATMLVPPGKYLLNGNLEVSKIVRIVGSGMGIGATGTWLQFAPGKGIRLRTSAAGTRPQLAELSNLYIRCVKDPSVGTWSADHDYSPGDRIRPSSPAKERGVHYVCVAGGRSGPKEKEPDWIPYEREGAGQVVDGTEGLRWEVDVFSGVYATVNIHLDRIWVDGATDSGIHLAATRVSPNTNVNTSCVTRCYSTNGDGHGIFIKGDNANGIYVAGCYMSGNRGKAIMDRGQFSNAFVSNVAESNRGGSYESSSLAGHSVWLGNYAEGDHPPVRLLAPALWFGGTNPRGFTADSTGIVFDGAFARSFTVESRTTGTDDKVYLGLGNANTSDLESFAFRVAHVNETGAQGLSWIEASRVWRWWYGNAETAYEITGERHSEGRGLFRLPAGYSLGKTHQYEMDRLPTASGTVPERGTRLWWAGDTIWNSKPVPSGYSGWRCTTQGGWGGGRFFSRRAYEAGLTVTRGDGIEPSTANGFVYRAKDFTINDSYFKKTGTEPPSWPKTPGQTVRDAAGIIWECFGTVGPTFKGFGLLES